MKSKQLNRNLYIIVPALIIFAVGYYLYSEVYTKDKEAHIIATKSRILEQMSQNLEGKVNSMETNALEYVGNLLDRSKEKKLSNGNFLSMLKQRKDIQYYNVNLEYVNSSEINNLGNVTMDSVTICPEAKPDFLYFHLAFGEKNGKHNKKEIQFKTRYDLLMTDFMQRNIFSDYILIVDSTIVYSTLPNKPNMAFDELGSSKAKVDESGSGKATSSGNIEFTTKSKIGQAVIKGVTTYDISISNNEYKLFNCQMLVDKKSWYICGLVKSEIINQSKKGMAPWVVILIFMVLSLIILGLPFIKLKVMSPTEQLTSGNLLNSAISLFLGTSFIILFIFFVTNAYWNRNQNELRLQNLAAEINDSLNTEIANAWNQLDTYDKNGVAITKSGEPLPECAKILMKNPLKPYNYPYFDYAFWMDTTGLQTGELTPFPKVEKPSNFSTRDYFKKPDEWILPGRENKRFRIESIVSKTSGIVKVALSKRSAIDHMVIAMTGRFYSIIEPIIPQDYKFCIIDRNGLVWFHSDKLRNLQENFLTECSDDNSLSAVIYANATRTLDLNYYDEPYRIHIKPLSPMPLYLVTMFDKKAEYAYQVQGLMLTLLLFSSLVMFIFIEILAIYVLKPFVKRSGWKNMIMDFIGAKEDHKKIYIVMSALFVLISILYLLLANPINILNPLLFAFVMITFLFPYLKYAISGFSIKPISRNIFSIINLVFLVLINIVSIRVSSNNDLTKLLIFQIAIIVLLIACFFVLKSDFKLKTSVFNITFYVCFLLGLLLVFSVAPSIKFFEAAVNHEIVRGIKHDQLTLARQRESRNMQLGNYYTLLEQNHKLDSSAVTVYEQRMERGIYSKFLGSTFFVKGKTHWKEMDVESKNFIRKNKVSISQTGDYIINFFRPVYDRTSIETKYLESDSLMNGSQKWSYTDKSLEFDYSSSTERYANQKSDSCRISTILLRPDIFNPLSPDKSVTQWSIFRKLDFIFILSLLFILYGIYCLILFGTKRLLGISILEMHTDYNFGDFIRERLASGHSVFVVSSPFVNFAEHIKETLKANFNLGFLDFAMHENVILDEKPSGEKDILIIENFAFDYYSPVSLKLQLDTIIEKIRKNEKIVIIGVNAPYFIQDYLQKKAKPNTDAKDKSDEVDTWEQLLLSFNNMLANINVLFTPEKYDQLIPLAECYSKSGCGQLKSDYSGDSDENVKCSICQELKASSYLQRYTGEMMKFYDELVERKVPGQIIKDRIIARIMDLSRLYYDGILASCTPMERFVLSDMAQDMIVNSKNKKVVNFLIHRGLFVINGCAIKFMNESFRKHVVLRFTDVERARLKEKLEDTGSSWQGAKLILVLIMVGLITFLFIANRSILDNLNKLFLVIGGGTVLITNLTGLLTRKETGNTK